VGTTALVLISSATSGQTAGYSLIAVGLFNSIMFPTIFSLAIEGAGPRTAEASGLLCMAIVGGAVVPYLTGVTADHVGLSLALLVPAVCYVFIFVYGLLARSSTAVEDSPVTVAP
jgi:FHS family L-fucose permease-like MFS transporter